MTIKELQVGKCYRYHNTIFIVKGTFSSPADGVYIDSIDINKNLFCFCTDLALYRYELAKDYEEVDINIFYKLRSLYGTCFSYMNSLFHIEDKEVYGKDGNLI